MSALVSKADMCGAVADVGYGPKADIAHSARSNRKSRSLTRLLLFIFFNIGLDLVGLSFKFVTECL